MAAVLYSYTPLGLKDELVKLIHAHPLTAWLIIAFAAFFVFNAFVQSLDAPTEKDGRAYRMFYRFMHALAFNIIYAVRAKFPQYVPPTPPQEPPKQ